MTWAVNSVTLAVLMSSIWWSAQQRPSSLPRFSATPAAAEANKRPVSEVGVTAATRTAIGGPASMALSNPTLDGDGLHRVAFSTTVKR